MSRLKDFIQLIAVFLFFAQTSVNAMNPDTTKVESLKKKAYKYSFVPLPSYDPSTKFGVSFTNLFTYRINQNDTISPYCMGGVGLQLTTNGSITIGGGNSFYLNEDRWRASIFALYGRMNQKLDLGYDHETRARRIVYIFNIQALRNVYRRLYVGLGYSYRQIQYKGRSDGATQELKEAKLYGGEGNHGIKYLITNDKRENVIYPYKGYYAAIRVEQYFESDKATPYLANYLDFRHFINVGEKEGKHIIAYRVLGRFLGGSPLEQNFSYYGRTGGAVERGYESGSSIDKNLLNMEAEYRLKTRLMNGKLGFAGFTGIGKVFGYYNDFDEADWLPMIGGGVRYCIVPQARMNVRFDLAAGKDGVVFYFGLREAF